jgi:hypothetical protein
VALAAARRDSARPARPRFLTFRPG